MRVYVVYPAYDGPIAAFSTLEKARAYASQYWLDCGIASYIIDDPSSEQAHAITEGEAC